PFSLTLTSDWARLKSLTKSSKTLPLYELSECHTRTSVADKAAVEDMRRAPALSQAKGRPERGAPKDHKNFMDDQPKKGNSGSGLRPEIRSAKARPDPTPMVQPKVP